MSMYRKQSWLIVAAIVGLAISLAWLIAPAKIEKAEVLTLTSGQLYPEPRALDAFQLVTHKGTAFTTNDLQGHWSFVFFGYTHCPDICPMTLGEMARLQSVLPAHLKANTRFIFVTVDPERDTVEQLAQYLPFFNADITGLTGEVNTLSQFTRQLGVAFSKVEQAEGGYVMDHSVRVFLLNAEGKRFALFSPTQGASFRADDLLADYQAIRAHFVHE